MVRERKEKRAKNIKLKQPDRSGPTDKTLFDIADERNLFKQAAAKERKNKRQNAQGSEDDDDDDDEEEGIPPGAERILETMLYTVSLTMLHLTLDVLVQQQYAIEMEWFKIIQRALQALMGMLTLAFPALSLLNSLLTCLLACTQSSLPSSTLFIPTPPQSLSSPVCLSASRTTPDKQYSLRWERPLGAT